MQLMCYLHISYLFPNAPLFSGKMSSPPISSSHHHPLSLAMTFMSQISFRLQCLHRTICLLLSPAMLFLSLEKCLHHQSSSHHHPALFSGTTLGSQISFRSQSLHRTQTTVLVLHPLHISPMFLPSLEK